MTGAAGFIGSNLVETLLELGQNVVGLDNFSTGKRENLARAGGGERWAFRFIEGDIRSLDDLPRAPATASTWCCTRRRSAACRARSTTRSPSHDNNVNGFLNMLVAARDAGVPRFVYASSSAVYGDDPALPKVEERDRQRRSRPTA